MEHKQFISNALKLSPPANLSFQADKYMRKSNCLSIPDTIHEQAELSGDSTKMEGSNDFIKIFNCDEKENINSNQQAISNESSDNSVIISIDNSFIKKCEKKLLESSSSDEEKTVEFENKSSVNNQLLRIPSRLVHGNDSISTPPSALRKEINLLRNELAATEEFHDFEILLLKEEKTHNEVELQDYLQVVEKNAALIELYTNLKNEYDEYRKQQEKMRNELQSKTADCLESLCLQIEASDSSLNFSNASFISFNAGIKSSTMMEDNSEVEATVMHDATVLTSDPLSITLEGTFKTPMQTPLKSAKKLFPHQVNWTSKISDVKEVKEIIDKRQSTMLLDSKYDTRLLTLEKALNDKLKEVEGLEERLFKMEDTCNSLRGDCERSTEILSKKTEQLNELTQKLFTEIISLNPALRDSLIDAPGPKLLVVFIETIMEKCKNVQDELIQKHICEKMELDAQRKIEMAAIESLKNQTKSLNEQLSLSHSRLADLEDLKLDLEKKLTNAENELLTREVEMRILQTSVREAREDFTSSAEALLQIQSQLSSVQNEKKQVENHYQELEETVRCLKSELERKEKLLIDLDNIKSGVTDTQKKNQDLKELIQQSEEIMIQLKAESFQREQELLQELEWLKNKDASRFSILFQSLEDFKKSLTEYPDSMLGENSTFTSLSEKLRECSDYQLLSAAEAILECAKIDYDAKRKSDLNELQNLRSQVKVANEQNAEFKIQLSDALAENSQIKKLCDDFKKQLLDAGSVISLREEEIMRFKKDEEILKKLKEDIDLLEDTEAGDSLADRIEKIISEIPELQKNEECREAKMSSAFAETLAKSFKGVQNEFYKRIENKRLEWENQRNVDLDLIETLEMRIKTLSEKSNELEVEISKISLEKEHLEKTRNNLIDQMAEAETIISTNNEEIRILRDGEMTLKRTKDELIVASETILTLKSQMTFIASEKDETELRCRKLEENTATLEAEIETKETIIKGLYELREKMENQSDDLRRQIIQSEDTIIHLKRELESAVEEQSAKESRIRDLLNDIDSLTSDKKSLLEFSERIEKLEKTNKGLTDIFSDVQSHLDLPEDTMTKLLSGNLENKKIFSEKINSFVKAQAEELKAENKTLKLVNDNLKDKVKQLTKLLCETANADIKEELANLNVSQSNAMTLRSKSSKNVDLFVRRLDKLEDLNHNLTELLTEVLTMLDFPDLDKLRLSKSNFSAISKRVTLYVKGFLSKLNEMKEENAQLDEECETYSNIIKDLKKEATALWRTNEEKTETMQSDISRMKEEKALLEKERADLLAKISRLEGECQRIKSESRTEGPLHNCNCMNESKKINDLKRAILIKEQKLLEFQDLEAQTSSYKSQIEYLKNALEREKKKVAEEKDKSKKLQSELNEAIKNHKPESKKEDHQNEILDELRMRGSLNGGGVVQEFVDKEKMRKLSKDIGILKELCRARYVEIKRLEALNASLRNKMPKNSNQMDSPIRSRGYVTRSKNPIVETWKTESTGKENSLPFTAQTNLH